MTDRRNITVVGGGIAGLAAARVLLDRGHSVTVYDKGRGPGGRASTRRSEVGPFDHGAQYFTVRDAGFAGVVDGWRAACVAAPWDARFGVFRSCSFEPDPPKERLVGVPGMNAIVRAMGEGISVQYNARATSIERTESGWTIGFERSETGHECDAVVVAVPPVQAVDLVRDAAPALAGAAETAMMAPCWTSMLAFDRPVRAAFDGAAIESDPDSPTGPLGWIARDDSKPGRPSPPGERWVLQAGPVWSAAHLEEDPRWVLDTMVEAFSALVGPLPQPTHARAHRWRYASVQRPVGKPCLIDRRGLAVCGDWLLHARVEAAWLSGTAAGAAISMSGPDRR